MHFRHSSLKLLLVTLVLSLSGTAAFGDSADARPCKAIKDACTAAGFVKGEHKEHKGLWKDCIDPILSGQTVAGVTINPADIAACQAKKAAKHHS